jgi:hypothetical protein
VVAVEAASQQLYPFGCLGGLDLADAIEAASQLLNPCGSFSGQDLVDAVVALEAAGQIVFAHCVTRCYLPTVSVLVAWMLWLLLKQLTSCYLHAVAVLVAIMASS